MDGGEKGNCLDGVMLELTVRVTAEGSRVIAVGSRFGALGGLALLITLVANALECSTQDAIYEAFKIKQDLVDMEDDLTNWGDDFLDMVEAEKFEGKPEEYVKGMS